MIQSPLYSTVINRKVLFGECDPAGIVYTPRFSDFTLEAVHEVIDSLLGGKGIQTLVDQQLLLPVRALSHDFISPVAWGDNLALEVNLVKIGQHSLSFAVQGQVESAEEEQVESEKRVAFNSDITLVFVSAVDKRPAKVPANLIEHIDALR